MVHLVVVDEFHIRTNDERQDSGRERHVPLIESGRFPLRLEIGLEGERGRLTTTSSNRDLRVGAVCFVGPFDVDRRLRYSLPRKTRFFLTFVGGSETVPLSWAFWAVTAVEEESRGMAMLRMRMRNAACLLIDTCLAVLGLPTLFHYICYYIRQLTILRLPIQGGGPRRF